MTDPIFFLTNLPQTPAPVLTKLPPLENDVLHLVHLLKRNKHVAIAIAHQAELVFTVTIHQVDARRLAKALLAIADGPEEGSTFVEGAYLGGPPTREQVLDPPE